MFGHGDALPSRMPNIIVFGPHPDDQELGMGGTIAKLADQGHHVLIVDVTDGSPTPRGDRASRLVEAQEALKPLQPTSGRGSLRRILLDLPNRTVEHTIAARHVFAGAIRAHQASIVFAPYWEDAHPDHKAVTRIAEDARFDAKLTKVEMPVPAGYDTIGPPIYPKWFFYYNCSHLRIMPQPSFIVDITGYEQRKHAATIAYRSQFGPWDSTPPTAGSTATGDPKSGFKTSGGLVTQDLPKLLMDIGSHYGFMIGTKYGEPFYTKEPLGLGDLSSLLG